MEKDSILLSDIILEGFSLRRNQDRSGKIIYTQTNERNIEDGIFDSNGSIRNRDMKLSKSGVIVHNLFYLRNLDVNRALKHKTDLEGNPVEWDTKGSGNVELFFDKAAILIKYLIGNEKVDIFTYPQSSSELNKTIINKVRKKYPNSEGFRIYPEAFIKNVRGIVVDEKAARAAGLTDEEIQRLQHSVDVWHRQEDIRDLRKKIETGNFSNQEVETILSQIKDIRSRNKMRGRDSTVDRKTGKVKSWQIKSVPDEDRRFLKHMFTVAPEYIKYSKEFKSKNVVLFDDNLVSGTTLDEICCTLQELGVNKILAFTLGLVAPTEYEPVKKGKYNRKNKESFEKYGYHRGTLPDPEERIE